MHSQSITGAGIGIAVLDTGIYPHIDFREVMIVFVLHYTVKTERNTVITNEGINLINVLGKIVHDRGNKK